MTLRATGQASRRQRLLRQGGPTILPENRIKNPDELRRMLQSAVELEHATIPPYLCALYSLKEGTNREAAQIIKSVVMEEMLHMILAANLLNAVCPADGRHGPRINHAEFIPRYPTHLPGNVGERLMVNLDKFSREAIGTFLTIERPAKPQAQPERLTSGETAYHSIGQFYEAIELGLSDLSDQGNIFTGDPSRQVTPEHYYGGGGRVVRVHDLASAKDALNEIIGQGEGLHHTIWDGDQAFGDEVDELAHYFRFNEIHVGRRYDPRTDTPSSGPHGAPLDVQWDKVHPMHRNPRLADYPIGSELWHKTLAFNRTYMSLLDQVHHAVNGEPKRLMQSVALMYDLKYQASELLNIPIAEGMETAGPSFEYVQR